MTVRATDKGAMLRKKGGEIAGRPLLFLFCTSVAGPFEIHGPNLTLLDWLVRLEGKKGRQRGVREETRSTARVLKSTVQIWHGPNG